MKEVEFFDTDFLGNKIEIGDKVILETPKYRDFVIGTVISKAPKSCQIEYQSFCTKTNVTVRQYYEQLIKYPLTKEGKWEKYGYKWKCSICDSKVNIDGTPLENNLFYCSHCGAKMSEE